MRLVKENLGICMDCVYSMEGNQISLEQCDKDDHCLCTVSSHRNTENLVHILIYSWFALIMSWGSPITWSVLWPILRELLVENSQELQFLTLVPAKYMVFSWYTSLNGNLNCSKALDFQHTVIALPFNFPRRGCVTVRGAEATPWFSVQLVQSSSPHSKETFNHRNVFSYVAKLIPSQVLK